MSRNEILSTISLNLLFAMDGQAFASETIGCIVAIKGEEMFTNTDKPITLTDGTVELLYQEFIWNLEKMGLK